MLYFDEVVDKTLRSRPECLKAEAEDWSRDFNITGGISSQPHLIHEAFGPHKSTPQGISTGSAVFAQYISVTTNTNRQTHTQTHKSRYVRHL